MSAPPSTPFPALAAARVYGILDLGYVQPGNVEAMTAALCEGGVDLLQLRAKKLPKTEIEKLARQMQPITRSHGVPLILNDHLDIAAATGSEGVHVGQDDEAVARARAFVGQGVFIGKSTHSPEQAAAAQEEGADYIGFGPLYATGTKPDYVPIGLGDIAAVQQRARVPVFCIGGVNAQRLPEVLAAGARRVVVVSAFLLAADVRGCVRQLKAALGFLLLTLLCQQTAWPQAANLPRPDAPLPPILRAWAEAQKGLGDIEVPFQQTRTLPALKQPVSAQGSFWRFADGAFRWELGRPPATVLVHDGSEFRVREAPDTPWQVLQEDDARYRMWARFLSGRETSPEELTRHFLISTVEDSSGITTVTLRPKAPFVRRHLRQLDLQISPKTKRLLQLRILQGDGATVLMQFAEPKPVKPGVKATLLAR